MMTYFKVTDLNYIGTPSGTLFTDKEIKEVFIYDLINEKETKKEYKYKYKVESSDSSLYIEDKLLGFIHMNQYYES